MNTALQDMRYSQPLKLSDSKEEYTSIRSPMKGKMAMSKTSLPLRQVDNMVDKHLSLDIGDSKKLNGMDNYNVWQLKMKALFMREKLWSIVETHRNLVLIRRKLYTKEQLVDAKSMIHSTLVLVIKDKLKSSMSEKKDPSEGSDLLS